MNTIDVDTIGFRKLGAVVVVVVVVSGDGGSGGQGGVSQNFLHGNHQC